jgi:hypothetical protein
VRSEEELRAFFRDELRPHVEAWNRRPRFRPPGLLDLVVVVVAVLAAVASQSAQMLWLLPAWGVVRVMRDVARVQGEFKREILRRMIEFALPGGEYDPGGYVAPRHIQACGLFRESWNDEGGEDFVSGKLGDTKFFFSELRLVKRRSKDREDVVFSGLFFVADFHKSFRGRTYLLPDVAERAFGALGRVAQALPRLDGTELVELENPDFEKRFVCYATDPVEARYLLSPSMMQRVLDLCERASGAARLSFVDESLYLALPRTSDLFSAPFLRGSVNEAAMLAWVAELRSVARIVEDLDLNTRIWSKS